MNPTTQEFQTIIGADASFKGDISFDSAAKFLGRFEGSIAAKGRMLVADGATCKATVTAKEVTVEGQIEGNVQAGDRVEIKSTGRITGDIVAPRMSMADGASIDGHVRIGSSSPAGGRTAATAEVKPSTLQQQAVAVGKR